MTGVETPPPPSTGRQCPRCGAALTDVQEWCLHCGAAVGTRVVAAPGWRTPIVVVGGLLALAAVAIAVALVQLADDTGDVTQDPAVAAATPTPPAAAPTPTPTPTLPEASGQETPTPTPDANATPIPTPTTPSGGGSVASWPAGESGWTVILSSDETKSEAQTKARGFTADGVAGVGVLNSDNFSSLKPGYWVVFSGEYDSQSAASAALDGLDVKDAYVRRVVPD